jgi:60 kDa SS-A/Ro ribonucleoprotein
LGSAPKRLVREWLGSRDEDALFSSSGGQNPSLLDIVKMVHPKPAGPVREAFYGYMLGRSYNSGALPKLVMQLERFKAARYG